MKRVDSKNPRKSLRKTTVQNLADDQKSKRKTCCQWIRKNINNAKLHRMMFTDEKIFRKNGYFNPHNDVVWADDRSDANERGGLFSVDKYPVCIMVALGVTWEGVTRPYFFLKDERLNGQLYLDQLLPFYKKEGDRLFGHSDWGLQQDNASCHTDRKAQDWCSNNFKFYISKNKWPSNSPELNPLDYSIWDSISNHMDYHRVNTINDLYREIRKSVKKIDVTYVREVIGAFLRRVYSVEKHQGELIIDDYS